MTNGSILIVGGSGQLGLALGRALDALGRTWRAPSSRELDLTAANSGDRVVELAPAAVINAASWNDVGGAERPEHREAVFAINRDGPRRLADACATLDVPFVHVSTDYVFDGSADRPYTETDPAAPLQVYGASKLAGEDSVRQALPQALIVRTSTVYGERPNGPPHYVDAILRQATEHGELSVVRPPVSSPTFTPDLAAAILALLEVRASGLVHVVNDGACSRLELATEAVRLAGLDVAVGERPPPAGDLQRPAYSVLDTSRYTGLTGRPMRPWQQALADYVQSREE